MATPRLSKVGRDHLQLLNHMAEQWRNPPKGFNPNPWYDADKAARKQRMNTNIKENLDQYHRELRHKSSEVYYELMEIRETFLKSLFDEDYNRI